MNTSYGEVDEVKFWSWVKFSSSDECWEWLGGKNSWGYGQFNFFQGKKQITGVASRIAYELFFRTMIPKGLNVCHKCDNPSCTNPNHFFLGTQKDNLQDAAKKKRTATGIKSGAYIHPESRSYGQRNGKYTHPEKTPRGKTHGSQTHPESVNRGENHWKCKLKWSDVLEIRYSLENNSDLAKKYGVRRRTVWAVKKGLTRMLS